MASFFLVSCVLVILVVVALLFVKRSPAPKLPLNVVPAEVRAVLEKAALEYAAMSPSDFEQGVLYVGSTKLRQLGLIDGAVWAKVPAHDNVRVEQSVDGSLKATVLLAGL